MFRGEKRPNWNEFEKRKNGPDIITTKEFVIRGEKTSDLDKRFLVVYFNENLGYEVFGTKYTPPLNFSYELGKSIYVADIRSNGTPDCPYEHLFLR